MVLAGIVVSGLESVLESAGPGPFDAHEHGHEAHDPLHFAGQDQDDEGEHDDHFCHCGVHSAALIATEVTLIAPRPPRDASRLDVSFETRHSPPLLRPPKA